MKFEIGIIMNADGFSCFPVQSIQCIKYNLKLLGNLVPSYCHIVLRLKPGNNSRLDYLSLVINSFLDPRCCQISLSKPSIPLSEWISSRDILACFLPSSAIECAAFHYKKVYLLKNNCNFFPNYITLDDSTCPLISPKDFCNIILNSRK